MLRHVIVDMFVLYTTHKDRMDYVIISWVKSMTRHKMYMQQSIK